MTAAHSQLHATVHTAKGTMYILPRIFTTIGQHHSGDNQTPVPATLPLPPHVTFLRTHLHCLLVVPCWLLPQLLLQVGRSVCGQRTPLMFCHKRSILVSLRRLADTRMILGLMQLSLVHAFTFDTSADSASTPSVFAYIAITTVVRPHFALSQKQIKS